MEPPRRDRNGPLRGGFVCLKEPPKEADYEKEILVCGAGRRVGPAAGRGKRSALHGRGGRTFLHAGLCASRRGSARSHPPDSQGKLIPRSPSGEAAQTAAPPLFVCRVGVSLPRKV